RRAAAVNRKSCHRDSDGLRFHVLVDALDAPLAADAAVLVAAEGQIAGDARTAVDADRAGAHAPRHLERPFRVAGNHIAEETIVAVVGNADRILIVFVCNDRQHRAEDLFARDLHVIGDIDEAGGFDEESAALVGPDFAASQQARALLLAGLNIAHDAILLPL